MRTRARARVHGSEEGALSRPSADSIALPFEFGRSSLRPRRPFLRDIKGSVKSGRSADSASPVEPPVETQLRLQTQQEELGRLQQEQEKLREELASQKVEQRLASQFVVQRRWCICCVFVVHRSWCICCVFVVQRR